MTPGDEQAAATAPALETAARAAYEASARILHSNPIPWESIGTLRVSWKDTARTLQMGMGHRTRTPLDHRASVLIMRRQVHAGPAVRRGGDRVTVSLEDYARYRGIPWPLPAPEPGEPDLLRESLERELAARLAVKAAFGVSGGQEWT